MSEQFAFIREVTKALETLIRGEGGTDLDLHNNRTLVYRALPENLAPLKPSIFCPELEMVFKVMAWALLRSNLSSVLHRSFEV